MRKRLRKFLPDRDTVRKNRWLRLFGAALMHPRLWHLNRHSAAGAVAAGLFCGLIPGPFQMLGASICALAFRINLPLALLTTLYTNPFTIVPLYVAAYEIGRLVTGDRTRFLTPPAFDWAHLSDWIHAIAAWMIGVGRPLAIGIVVLASGLALIGYFVVKAAWRIHLLIAWRRRHNKKTA